MRNIIKRVLGIQESGLIQKQRLRHIMIRFQKNGLQSGKSLKLMMKHIRKMHHQDLKIGHVQFVINGQ